MTLGLSRSATGSALFEMSRGLTVSVPYIQLCQFDAAGAAGGACGAAVCAARAIALRMRG
jgi:hypothetical protein